MGRAVGKWMQKWTHIHFREETPEVDGEIRKGLESPEICLLSYWLAGV